MVSFHLGFDSARRPPYPWLSLQSKVPLGRFCPTFPLLLGFVPVNSSQDSSSPTSLEAGRRPGNPSVSPVVPGVVSALIRFYPNQKKYIA